MKGVFKHVLISLFFVFFIHSPQVQCARILFLFGVGSPSHRIALQPLINALAERDHNVTVFSLIPPSKPNPKVLEVCPPSVRRAFDSQLGDYAKQCILARLGKKNYDKQLVGTTIFDTQLTTLELMVKNPDYANWLKNDRFDLIIHDTPGGQFSYGVAHEMKAKIIAFISTSTVMPGDAIYFGLPEESSWLPGWTLESDYWFIPNRFVYAYESLIWYFWSNWYLFPKIDTMLKEFYDGKELPAVQELVKNVDLILLNEHFSSGFAKALPPYAVPVGGMHIQKSDGALPNNLEEFLKSKDRFVYISFGSILKVSDLPPDFQKVLYDAVGSLKDVNFLWKWEGTIPDGLPKNVLAMNWFPQQDVLAHPKCKGFVTQGGIMSYQQGIFNGVPLLVIPIWGDQSYVAGTSKYHEIGIHLELADITKETLTKALRDLLNNEKYKKNVEDVSKRFLDRPMSPVETAVWWIEYVLRHDTGHLKSPGFRQSWWQTRLLDFWACVLISILFCLYLVLKCYQLICRFLQPPAPKNEKVKNS